MPSLLRRRWSIHIVESHLLRQARHFRSCLLRPLELPFPVFHQDRRIVLLRGGQPHDGEEYPVQGESGQCRRRNERLAGGPTLERKASGEETQSPLLGCRVRKANADHAGIVSRRFLLCKFPMGRITLLRHPFRRPLAHVAARNGSSADRISATDAKRFATMKAGRSWTSSRRLIRPRLWNRSGPRKRAISSFNWLMVRRSERSVNSRA